MVRVPAGPFLMGLPEGDLLAEDHEKPQRTVELAEFWIDVYPVTNAQFARFLQAGGYDEPRWWSPAGWTWRAGAGVDCPGMWGESGWDGREQPVAGVSWYEADAYARWAGKRLPSDAEWENGLRSVAATVRWRDGQVVAAVCAISVQPTMTIRTMEVEYLPAVIRTANTISQALGFAC